MKKKKKKVVLIAVLSAIVLSVLAYQVFLKRTPERILKINYGLSLKEFDYTVNHFDERWAPNGDGHIEIDLKFDKLTPENLLYLKSLGANPLPIPDSLKTRIPFIYTELKNGLYFYSTLSERDDSNYRIFIINTETNEAFFYYTIS